MLGVVACASADVPEPSPELPEEPAPVPVLPPPAAVFEAEVQMLTQERISQMRATSWRAGCPTPLADLRLLRVRHWDFEDQLQWGELVLHVDAADAVQGAFKAAFDTHFAIRGVRPVSDFEGSDDLSMGADNTSAFNCRMVKGTSSWSAHSSGSAIDINPRENPWVKGGVFDPPEGDAFANRQAPGKGKLRADSALTLAFVHAGWGWGGNWTRLKDYQHFSKSGK